MVIDIWNQKPPIQSLRLESNSGIIPLDVARFDQIHPILSGNKFYKLYYSLQRYCPVEHEAIVSYGGMYSNHLHALSYLAHELDMPTRFYIRGWKGELTPTLKDLMNWQSELRPISRTQLRSLRYHWTPEENSLLIPEGGADEDGVRGAAEMYLRAEAHKYDQIVVPLGSGTTFEGLARHVQDHQRLIGILSFRTKLSSYIRNTFGKLPPNQMIYYTPKFGSFGKTNKELLRFATQFENQYNLPIDRIYGARAFYAISTESELFDILAYGKTLYFHTGGLQGNRGLCG